MRVIDWKTDSEAKARFERNVAALAEHDADLAERLRAIDSPVTSVVDVDGDLNLDIGHTLFYETGVRRFVDEQYSAFVEDPYRIDIAWPLTDETPPQMMTKLSARRMNEACQEQGIGRRKDGKQRAETGFAVSLGVGIGDHIGRLLRDHKAQSLIIVEQFIEFLWHSLHLNPWDEWIELVESRNGKIFTILHDSAPSASSELTDALRSDNGGTLDGALIYTHYRSHLVREIHRGLSDQISYIGSNRGFFEDENIMLQNSTRNFLRRDHAIWRSRPRREKDCPAFVVAAGPSVDMAIDTIRTFRDNVVLISCGSGLKTLLSMGIRPDFHVEVENTFGQAAILERVASQHSLAGITLVAAATVNPRTAAVFDKVIFFHRDTVCSSRFYELNGRPTYLAVPTVANGGVRFAVGMGFKEVYMFGVDFGSRIAGYHHSKASAYYSDEEFMFSFQGTQESTEFNLTSEGNLGGTVLTHDGFLLSRLFLQKLARAYKGYTIYNCSDGVDIPFTVPKLPETVSVAADPARRDRAIAQISEEVDHVAKSEGVPLDRLRELRDKTVVFHRQLQDVVDELEAETERDIFETYAKIYTLFEAPDDAFDPVMAVVWQNDFGTVMTMFNQFFRIYRRVEDGDVDKVYAIFLAELRAFGKDMESILLSVIDELIAETLAVRVEPALSA
jgi:hypothetical protein